jgi:hypothetical protein
VYIHPVAIVGHPMIFKSSGSREEVNSSLLKYKTSQDNVLCFDLKIFIVFKFLIPVFYPKTMLQKVFVSLA